MRLRIETALAREAGRLSRLLGRGGGTTLPGKLLVAVDPAALGRLARSLPLGVALVSATNGKTTTTAMAAEILRPRVALAHNAAGANLLSGVASALLEARDAQLGLFEADEGALPELVRRLEPRAVSLGNLFRDQLDRYGELELVAERWLAAVQSLPDGVSVVVAADDPALAAIAQARPGAVRFGLDDPSAARERLPHAADSKHCRRCGAPYDYAAAYVGHLGDYRCRRCGIGRAPLDVLARGITPNGLEGIAFDLMVPEGMRRVTLAVPGVYNVYNALAAAALCRELGATLDEIAEGLSRFRPAFGRFERIEAGDRRALVLLVKNPAGANEAVRTIVEGSEDGVPVAMIALNDEIADGRDVSWIWDVDFEPLLERLGRLVAAGGRAEELALRFKYAGYDESRIEVEPDPGRALERGLELTAPGGELIVLPTYTAMLALREAAVSRGLARPYWEQRSKPPR